MKKNSAILMLVMLLSAAILMAQDDAFSAYQKNPTEETFAAAQAELGAQLNEDEANAQARIMLGWLYIMETDRQLAWFEEHSDELQPGQRFGWANLLLGMGRYDEAIAQYEKLNEASPKWSCPWRHRGEALYSSGHFAKAEEALAMAIETRVEHYDAYVWMAKAQHAQGKDKDALATLETGFTYLGKDIEDPAEELDDAEVKELYATLLEANGRTDEAQKVRAHIKSND